MQLVGWLQESVLTMNVGRFTMASTTSVPSLIDTVALYNRRNSSIHRPTPQRSGKGDKSPPCAILSGVQQPTLPTRNPCSLGTFPFRSLLLPITTSNKKITTKMTAICASNCPAQYHRQILGYGPYNACTAKKSALAMEAAAESEILAGLTRGVQVQIRPGCKEIGGPVDGCTSSAPPARTGSKCTTVAHCDAS